MTAALVTFRLWQVLAAALAAVVVGLLLMGCDARGATLTAASELDDGLTDVVQGCDWRATSATGYDPRDPTACYNVFTGQNARISFERLGNPCDATSLPSPLLVEPGNAAELFGYWDRSELETFEILRYERLDACP